MQPANTPLATRRLLAAVVACLVTGCGWAVVHAVGSPVPPVVTWLTVPVSLGLSALSAHTAARAPGLAEAGRRFWRWITVCLVLVALGAAPMLWARLMPAGQHSFLLLVASAPVLGLAILLGLHAILRLPVPARSRGEWVRLCLDGLTVLFTTAVFFWHFGLLPLLDRHRGTGPVIGLLLLSMISLVTLVAVMKVVLLGSGPVSGRSMRVFAGMVLVGGLGSAASPLIADARWVGLQPVITLSEALLATYAAHLQCRQATEQTPAWVRADRPYSKLPYYAVAANSVLLTVVAFGDHHDIAAVATGTIAVSALVAVRQLVALRDNAKLLASVRGHEQRFRHQATHDKLTELINRARFTELLADAMAEPATDRPVAVLLIDLDDFKLINDTLGHAVGDEVLASVAQRLCGAVRGGDVVARLGGDEFAALLYDVGNEHAVMVAQRIRDVLASPLHAHGHELLVHASVGVAQSTIDDELDTLLRNADLAMYAAKDRGKGGHFVYAPGMKTRMIAYAELGAQLREAIDVGQLFLLYQPIVDLDDGRLLATEALVRWQHPTRGLIPPTDFIPTAEQTGLIVPLGRWVLRRACAQQAAWEHRYGSAAPATISVNVAGRQLTEPDFVDDVISALADAGLDPRHLTIEVTETAVIDSGEAIAALQALRDVNIRIALDDFGTAASSLGLLLTCPVTTLKLDRTFVDEITTVARQEAVATAVIRMAQALDLDTVAEGIETVEQAQMLRSLGYRHGQGYLFARPLAALDLDGRIEAERTRHLAAAQP